MGVRYPGRASIDPSAPEAVGVCDRCGQLYNLRDLRYQPVYAGPNVLVTRLRVCTITCWDELNPQLKTIRIPPDPWPVSDPRVENFAVDEKNFLDLKAIIGKSSMFLARSLAECELYVILGLLPSFDAVSAFDGILQRDVNLAAEFDVTSALNVEIEVVSAPVSISMTDNYTFFAGNTHTETGASFGSEASDRLIFVAVSAFCTSFDGLDSITIGGIAGTLAVEELISAGGSAGYFSSIYYAEVSTGTTGDIVLTFTGDSIAAGVTVYRVVNANTVTPIGAIAQANVASGAVSASITPANGSVTIATAFAGSSSTDVDISWTNITEDTDQAINLGPQINVGSASRADSTSPGSTSISANATTDLDTRKTLTICNIVP